MKKHSLIETKGKFSLFGVNQKVQLTISRKGKDFLENEVVSSPIYTCNFQHSFTVNSFTSHSIFWPKHCCICLGSVQTFEKISGICSFPVPSPAYKSSTATISVKIPYCQNCYNKVKKAPLLRREEEGVSIRCRSVGADYFIISFKFRNPLYEKMFEKLNKTLKP